MRISPRACRRSKLSGLRVLRQAAFTFWARTVETSPWSLRVVSQCSKWIASRLARAMNKKYQIFVSSTFRDLQDERQDAIRSILDLGHIPAGMELFPAADTEQLAYIKKVIDECDYYVLIMGGRYGSLDEEGISFTEREYDYAVETGKVVLAFPHGDLDSIPVSKSDVGERMRLSLREFRSKVMTGRLVREWTSREQLEALVVKSLVRAMADYPAVGWVRGDAVASEDLLNQLNTVRAENESLAKKAILLEQSTTPQIESLAELDETVTVRYEWTKYYRGDSQKVKGTADVTWRAIVRAIGSTYMQPKTRSSISTSLSVFMKENGITGQAVSLFTTDINTIANHLIALKILQSRQMSTKDSGVHEFLTITDLGRKILLETSAVRSKSGAAINESATSIS